MVVLAVAVLLTGLLLPALSQVRENAHRVLCGTNLRQVGLGITMYVNDWDDALPASRVLEGDEFKPQELMAAYHPLEEDVSEPGALPWDGLGLLHAFQYCNGKCFYCPSHHGNHLFEEYEDEWFTGVSDDPIYTNYHYAGHRDWESEELRRLEDPRNRILATDGLRTTFDINHADGMNVLSTDGAVRFFTSVADIVNDVVPAEAQVDDPDAEYRELWRLIGETISGYEY